MSVRCAHLLIKHTGSRNPVSRRTGEQVTLSPEQALEELRSFEARIKAEGVHEAFPKYAFERSDCSSCRNKGDLGDFGRGMSEWYLIICNLLMLSTIIYVCSYYIQ